jgi:hypothetical protein
MVVQHREVQLVRPPVLVRVRLPSLGGWGRYRRVFAFADASGVFLGHDVPPSVGGTSARSLSRRFHGSAMAIDKCRRRVSIRRESSGSNVRRIRDFDGERGSSESLCARGQHRQWMKCRRVRRGSHALPCRGPCSGPWRCSWVGPTICRIGGNRRGRPFEAASCARRRRLPRKAGSTACRRRRRLAAECVIPPGLVSVSGACMTGPTRRCARLAHAAARSFNPICRTSGSRKT